MCGVRESIHSVATVWELSLVSYTNLSASAMLRTSTEVQAHKERMRAQNNQGLALKLENLCYQKFHSLMTAKAVGNES